jgi:hypothetical protein
MTHKLFRALALLLPLLSGTAYAGDPVTSDSLMSSVKSLGSSQLTGLLTQQLGVTQNQAEGGVGSMLKLAQEKLSAGDFDMIARAVPGAQKYLDKARSLGAYAGALNNLEGLNGALSKLGIPPETAARFVPAVTNFVGKAGGSKVGNLLKSAMI